VRRLLSASDFVLRVVTVAGHIGAWMAMPLMAFTVVDVVGRRFLNVGSTALQEWEWHFHTVLFAACFGFAYVRNAHIRVDLLRARWSTRKKAWMELFGIFFFMLPYLGLLSYYSWTFVAMSYAQNEASSAFDGLGHRWIIKSALLLMVALLVLACAAIVLRKIVFLFGPRDLDFRPVTFDRDPEGDARR
jgi:TRAP-type mannitol/chloroaromatic compound transport system permease small subunit